MSDTTGPEVTVVGLGAMGRAMAEAILAAGCATTVWNRSPDKADGLVSHGAVRADTVADAVTASPLVVVCVLDYEAAHQIVDPRRRSAVRESLGQSQHRHASAGQADGWLG